ncbi:MAG: Ger(x)C family spore germination protein [Bacilli bacterium]|nr:Ger(x)C family spore germination protein [Bacilli bacterium]
MKHLKPILLVIVIILLNGCWNYKELESLAIVGAIGIDLGDDDFVISVEVINPKTVASKGDGGSSSINETPSVVYEATGKTIREALNNVVLEAPYKLYLGHMHLLVISEDIAKKGIYDIMDFFVRDTESRKIFPITVVKNAKASEVLKTIKPLETITAVNIKASLEASSSISGIISNILFDEVLMALYVEGRHPTITAIEIINPSEEGETNKNITSTDAPTKIKIIGSATFKDDKLIGYLMEKDSIGYTIIRNQIESMTISFPCDAKGNYGNVVIDGLKNNLKVDLKKDKPLAKIDVTGNAALVEYNCKTDLTKQKNINKIKDLVNEELKQIIEKTIITTQRNIKSDIFGFGERLYKDHNNYWKDNKKKWNETFSTVPYEIKTNIKIERRGSTIDSTKGGV